MKSEWFDDYNQFNKNKTIKGDFEDIKMTSRKMVLKWWQRNLIDKVEQKLNAQNSNRVLQV